MKITPKPIEYVNPVTEKVTTYLPSFLKINVVYTVAKCKKTAWGTLVKTDRYNKWVNMDWFEVI